MTHTDTSYNYLCDQIDKANTRMKIAEGYMAIIKAYAFSNQKAEKRIDDIQLLIEKYDKIMKG